jgi:hypothetical protein
VTDRAWKQHERRAAALIDGCRYPANQGGAIDCESSWAVAQCKEVRTLSLAALEALTLEAERQGTARHKIGLAIVKRRAGRGVATPTLVIMTAPMLRTMRNGSYLPQDDPKYAPGRTARDYATSATLIESCINNGRSYLAHGRSEA